MTLTFNNTETKVKKYFEYGSFEVWHGSESLLNNAQTAQTKIPKNKTKYLYENLSIEYSGKDL